MDRKVYFVGAGPGAGDLITVRGMNLLKEADCVVYAGSLVAGEILDYCKSDAKLYDSAKLSLDEVLEIFRNEAGANKKLVRLHSGDPSIYGAIYEQIEKLDQEGFSCEVVPGVSSFSASAAALKRELTLPGISQTVILTRTEGRTAVPQGQRLSELAKTGSTLCIFLSVHMIDSVVQELLKGGLKPDTPVAIVERASRADQAILKGTLNSIAGQVAEKGIKSTAMIIVGEVLEPRQFEMSKLYDAAFSHAFRSASEQGD